MRPPTTHRDKSSMGRPVSESWSTVVAALEAGEPVVIPTDTVYGLAALPSVPGATSRLYALKDRRPDVPLAVLVAAPDALHDLAAEVDGPTADLVARHWPGPLTLVVRRHPDGPAGTWAAIPAPSASAARTTRWCGPWPRASGPSPPPAPTATASPRRPPPPRRRLAHRSRGRGGRRRPAGRHGVDRRRRHRPALADPAPGDPGPRPRVRPPRRRCFPDRARRGTMPPATTRGR